MKKILFPTDFSKSAKNAFEFADNLAKQLNATIDLVHVFDIPSRCHSAADALNPDYYTNLIAEHKEIAKKRMSEFAKTNGEKIAIFSVFVPEEITNIALEGEYDLIILGTKGADNPVEKLLGSIASRTMMNAPCPVLAIPEGAVYQGLKHIAYASDFNPTDVVAVEQLTKFSGSLGAELSYIHIDTSPEIGAFQDTILKKVPHEFTGFTTINNTSVQKGLDEYIEKTEVDLLALFMPKRKLWERLFHLSFSKKYMLYTKIPLLVFRELVINNLPIMAK